MALQISTTIDLLNAGVCVYLGVRLYRASQQDPASKTLHNFFLIYVYLTLAYVLLVVPRMLASQQTTFLGVAFAFGNACFLMAASFFTRIVLRFTKPKWVRVVIAGYHVLIAGEFLWSLLKLAQPDMDPATGITNWNVNLGVGTLSGILLLIVLIPGAILFMHKGLRTADNHVVRIRSITISIGAMLLIVSLIVFYLASSEVVAVIGDLASIGALLTVFLGVIYHRPPPLPVVQTKA